MPLSLIGLLTVTINLKPRRRQTQPFFGCHSHQSIPAQYEVDVKMDVPVVIVGLFKSNIVTNDHVGNSGVDGALGDSYDALYPTWRETAR